jgi:hypothetical protein
VSWFASRSLGLQARVDEFVKRGVPCAEQMPLKPPRLPALLLVVVAMPGVLGQLLVNRTGV